MNSLTSQNIVRYLEIENKIYIGVEIKIPRDRKLDIYREKLRYIEIENKIYRDRK